MLTRNPIAIIASTAAALEACGVRILSALPGELARAPVRMAEDDPERRWSVWRRRDMQESLEDGYKSRLY